MLKKRLPILLGFALATPYAIAQETNTAADLILMDFEDLVNLEYSVESAGKQESKLLDLPYAVSVVSADDIDRLNIRTIPDALRLVPGMHVEQISNSEWSVGIRGESGRFSRFVLFLVNGRSVFNSMFSGINWDELNLAMAGIERIEVIRGPNAAAWGSNAVNGIVNIITKSWQPEDSNSLKLVSGNHYKSGIELLSKQKLNDNWSSKFSGQAQKTKGLKGEFGLTREDDRVDWNLNWQLQRLTEKSDTAFDFMLADSEQAPYYKCINLTDLFTKQIATNESKEMISLQIDHRQQLNESWHWHIRGSHAVTNRNSELFSWDSDNSQLDLEISGTTGIHQITAGINSRRVKSSYMNSAIFSVEISPQNKTDHDVGFFIADNISLLDDKLTLNLAVRKDKNHYTDPEIQPSLRALINLTEDDRLWFATSRASATPSRALFDVTQTHLYLAPGSNLTNNLPLLVNAVSYAGTKNTILESLEVGYRKRWQNFNLDISAFQFDYSNNIEVVFNETPYPILNNGVPVYLSQPAIFSPTKDTSSKGFELSTSGQITPQWNVQLSYSYLDSDDSDTDSANIFYLKSYHEVSEKLDLNWMYRFNSGHQLDGISLYSSQDYSLFDFNMNYKFSENFVFSLSAKNLGRSKQLEDIREIYTFEPFVTEPHVYISGKVNW